MEKDNMNETIIYGKHGWPHTTRAREANPEHVYYDVQLDPSQMEEMLKHSRGLRKVPVIVANGQVTIGYGGSWGV